MNSFVIIVLALIAAVQANVIYKRLEPEDRIVGGEEAVPNSFPYQAFLLMVDTQFNLFRCGGSLLTTTKILTAAHCLEGRFLAVYVYLGAHDVTKNEETRQARQAIDLKLHSEYNGTTYANDIAIITLNSPVVLNEYVQLTTLPTRADVGKTYVGEIATVSGWGRFSDDTALTSDILRFVSSPVVTNEDCGKDYSSIIPPTQICISGKLMKAACNGDSGGPLVIGADRVQIGLVSYGRKVGCEKGFDVVYTRITEYLDWIASNGGVEIN